MTQEQVLEAERKISEKLEAEHIDFLEPKIMIHFMHGKINSILFKKDGKDFAFFIVNFTSNGYRCKGEESNKHQPIAKSKLLQVLIRTIVEETLDEEILKCKY